MFWLVKFSKCSLIESHLLTGSLGGLYNAHNTTDFGLCNICIQMFSTLFDSRSSLLRNAILFLQYTATPPPLLSTLSFRIGS